MIYSTKIKIARNLEVSRPTIDKMIDRGEIKRVKNSDGKAL